MQEKGKEEIRSLMETNSCRLGDWLVGKPSDIFKYLHSPGREKRKFSTREQSKPEGIVTRIGKREFFRTDSCDDW